MTPGEFKELYVTFRADPVNDEITDGQWCAQRGWAIQDLAKWKKLNPDVAQQILDRRRTRYAEHMSAVDKALFEKAKSGDTKAAALLYARFENWTPKAADEAVKRNPKNKTFAELIAEGGA